MIRGRRPTVLCLAAVLSVGLPACRSRGHQPSDPYERAWSKREPHTALRDGVTVQSHYYKHALPAIGEWYVVRSNGTFVRTFEELRRELRPLDTPELALAYRALLREVELREAGSLQALRESTSLGFHDGDSPFMGVFVADDAKRWNVPREPVIEAGADRIVITEPVFRWRFTWDDEARESVPGAMTVELARMTIHRDGTYEHDVLRVLEALEPDNPYGPVVYP